MAKKTKRTKRAKRKSSEPPVSVTPDCEVTLEFTGAFRKDRETVRRLAHRVVDMLADAGYYDVLATSLSSHLGYLVDDFVVEKVTDLLEEARAAGKEVPSG
ncbi:MAG: hypothetical protein IIB57_02515 [Planctomycetes bacterium]|nr:hypothetical protein [Planctomycetota bacterium]